MLLMPRFAASCVCVSFSPHLKLRKCCLYDNVSQLQEFVCPCNLPLECLIEADRKKETTLFYD